MSSLMRGGACEDATCEHFRFEEERFKMLLGVRFLGYKVQSNGRVKCDYRGNPIGDPNPQINLECSVKGCGHDVLVDLWLCVPCCKIVCLRHVQQHSERKRQDGRSTHIVFLSCNDTHIFCLKCNQFLYPREVSLNTSQEQEHFLTDFAFHWLQIFGRTRLWWRDLPTLEDHKSRRGARSGVRGFKNFGNTCFFSSTLQIFMHNTVLRDLLLFEVTDKDAYDNSSAIEFYLRETYSRYWMNKNIDPVSITPNRLWRAIKQDGLYGMYDDKQMEDANSLLLDLINALRPMCGEEVFGVKLVSTLTCSECNREFTTGAVTEVTLSLSLDNIEAPPSPDANASSSSSLSMLARDTDMDAQSPTPPPPAEHGAPINVDELLETDNPAANIFVRMMAMRCCTLQEALEDSKKASDPDEYKRYLPIQIRDLIVNGYLIPEQIADFKCTSEQCANERVPYTKQLVISKLPLILLLHIKRFAASPRTMGITYKHHRRVIVADTLALEQTAVDPETKEKTTSTVHYALKALVVHDGGMGGGHYMAYVRRKNGKWLWFSDTFYTQVTQEEVDTSEPFLCQYVQVDPPASSEEARQA